MTEDEGYSRQKVTWSPASAGETTITHFAVYSAVPKKWYRVLRLVCRIKGHKADVLGCRRCGVSWPIRLAGRYQFEKPITAESIIITPGALLRSTEDQS